MLKRKIWLMTKRVSVPTRMKTRGKLTSQKVTLNDTVFESRLGWDNL